MFLLDTNIIIAILRGKQEIVKKYQSISSKNQPIYLTTYSISEIYIGFQDQEFQQKNLEKLNIQKKLFDKMVNYLDAQKRVISLNPEDAKILGEFLYKLKARGKPIPLIDAILSAIAIS
ncbi:MAG: PIN domain-containing protein, partial [Candidatus Lokiarchaeota archaeon]|nr:PIN domain-containing protein [Candidatus Lokiarchaeota archaeon]